MWATFDVRVTPERVARLFVGENNRRAFLKSREHPK